MQAGEHTGEIDAPDDPMWAPVEGVTLEVYVAVSCGLLRYGIAGVSDIEQYATEHGVPEGRWASVQAGWVERIGAHREVRVRYGHLYSQRG